MRGAKTRFVAATAFFMLAAALGGGHADAAIVAVNDGKVGGTAPPANGIVSNDIAVGDGADMLILMYSGEFGMGGPTTASYGGVEMLLAVGNRQHSAIYYLDLSTPGITGNTLTVDMSAWDTKNGHASGWVSIDGNLGAGEIIALHSTGTSVARENNVDLTTTVETFNVISFNANETSSNLPTVNAPIQAGEVIYSDQDIGSARGAAAYDESVAAGTTNYSWNIGNSNPNINYRRIDAAAFAVVADLGGTIPGDFNNDSMVDAADYTVWRDNLGGNRDLLPAGSATSDMGTIDATDYELWRSNFGEPSASIVLSAVVPEASSLVLLLAGTLTVAGLNRRRRLPAA